MTSPLNLIGCITCQYWLLFATQLLAVGSNFPNQNQPMAKGVKKWRQKGEERDKTEVDTCVIHCDTRCVALLKSL